VLLRKAPRKICRHAGEALNDRGPRAPGPILDGLRALERRLARDERGQVLPLLAVAIVALLAAGMLVFWLALSTNYATVAQTAADAAALAGEKEVVRELQQPPVLVNGRLVQLPPDWGQIESVADQYARANGAKVIEFDHPPEATGYDVVVIVQTLQGLPAGSVDAGKQAVASARASTDPLGQSSPATPISNDASVATGPRFVARHTGKYGFFPAFDADFSVGAEPEIAGRLDKLATEQRLHINGVIGYAAAGAANDSSLHTCGAAATVAGLASVSDKQLKDAGLVRLFPPTPGQPDEEIGLTGTTRGSCLQGTVTATPATQPVAGNPNVHLVPLSGGPQESLLAWPGLGGVGPLGGPWAIPTPIVMCESGGRNLPPNYAGASGYYQIMPGTWAQYGGPGPAAYLAPKYVQDTIAAKIWAGGGPSQWVCAGLVKWA